MDWAVNRCPRASTSPDGKCSILFWYLFFSTDATPAQVKEVIRQIVTADLHHGHRLASRCLCWDMTSIVRGSSDAHAAQRVALS